jgi:amino acid transporter/nucleotide-binding universal stress UspA family protein
MSGLITSQKRPRELAWFHAGPLLFGDWGTSRLYVLGLAFYYTGHASPIYLTAMSLIMIAVAWAYSVICRCFPEGGGVYAAARQLSPTLAVVGATLLLCDYIVTAALSAVEGFHYFGLHGAGLVIGLSIFALALVFALNWFGARSAGRFALIIALLAIGLSAIIAVLCIPMIGEGFSTITTGHVSISDPWTRWENLVRVILALSGLEAVANMTGLMKQPVAKTARRTIFPVLVEVIVLNMIFGLALNALPSLVPVQTPHYVQYELAQNTAGPNATPKAFDSDEVPREVKEYRDTAMRQLAEHASLRATGSPEVSKWFGVISGLIFGLLLLSAVNTAIMAMVSVKYAMAADRELPQRLMELNYSGVPWLGLIIACLLPGALLLVVGPDAKVLAELYAIGVVGAIAINVLSCAVNRELAIGRWERRGMWALGVFMSVVFVTIVIAKPHAAVFAGGMIVAVLGVRTVMRRRALARAIELASRAGIPEPSTGWRAELEREPLPMDAGAPRIMLAARGRYQVEYAADLARQRGATLFAIYVRTLRLLDAGPGHVPRIADDPAALEALGAAALVARQRGVPFVPIYVVSPDIAEEILDYTVTYGCDTLIMGKSRRSLFALRVEGDVLSEVARHLPDGVSLLTREPQPLLDAAALLASGQTPDGTPGSAHAPASPDGSKTTPTGTVDPRGLV